MMMRMSSSMQKRPPPPSYKPPPLPSDWSEGGDEEAKRPAVHHEDKLPEPEVQPKTEGIVLRQKNDSMVGLTRLDQGLILASTGHALRSPRLTELNVQLVVESRNQGEDSTHLDGVDTLPVCFPLDAAYDQNSLRNLLDEVADHVDKKIRQGTVLICAHNPSKSHRHLQLNLNPDSAANDKFALAGCLGAAYLIKYGKMSAENAIDLIKGRRPEMSPNMALSVALTEFEQQCVSSSSNLKGLAKLLKWSWWRKENVVSLAQNWIPATIYVIVLTQLARLILQSFFAEPTESSSTGPMLDDQDDDSDDDSDHLICA